MCDWGRGKTANVEGKLEESAMRLSVIHFLLSRVKWQSIRSGPFATHTHTHIHALAGLHELKKWETTETSVALGPFGLQGNALLSIGDGGLVLVQIEPASTAIAEKYVVGCKGSSVSDRSWKRS